MTLNTADTVTMTGDVYFPLDMDGISLAVTFREFFDVPYYIPDEQVFRYLEKNGSISSELRQSYEIKM